jgi:hypothetical protein
VLVVELELGGQHAAIAIVDVARRRL